MVSHIENCRFTTTQHINTIKHIHIMNLYLNLFDLYIQIGIAYYCFHADH